MEIDNLTSKLIQIISSDRKIPLYLYRLSSEDYQSLKNYLQAHSQSLIKRAISRSSLFDYDKLFVLYASEWWRREYQGDWRWQDVLNSIGLTVTDFGGNQSLLRLTENGLKKWHRPIQRSPKTGHRNALGSFMREGGLPIAYFNSNGGWLGQLLEGALVKIIQEDDYESYLQNNSYKIPSSAGTEDILLALQALTKDIYHLIVQHKLDEKSDPISYLNDHVPNWQDQLPFPLEAQAAQDLLKNLIVESARNKRIYSQRTKDSPSSAQDTHWQNFIHLQRIITIHRHDKSVELTAKLSQPSYLPLLHEDNVKQLINDTININLFSQSNDNVQDEANEKLPEEEQLIANWQAYPVFNQKRLKFRTQMPAVLSTQDWCAGLSMSVLNPIGEAITLTDNQQASLNPYQNTSMYRIDDNLPFLAEIEASDDNKIVAKYIGSNSQRTKQRDAILYIPDSCRFEMSQYPNTALTKTGPVLKGTLYHFVGSITLHSADGNTYQFHTNCKDAHYHYEIRGQRLENIQYPKLTLRQGFKVYKINVDNPDDVSIVRDDTIFLRPIANANIKKLSDYRTSELMGVYYLIAKSGNDVVFQHLIGIVPNDFKTKLLAFGNNSLTKGKLVFDRHAPAKVEVLESQFNVQVEKSASGSGSTKTEFLLETNELPNKKITLALYPQENQHNVKSALHLRCHFPSSQTAIYDPQGKALGNNLLLTMDTLLYGYRIKIYSGNQSQSPTLRFYLKSTPDITIDLPIMLNANEVKELEPHYWSPIIKDLMRYSSKGLNESVIVTLENNKLPGFTIGFGYYDYQIDKSTSKHLMLKCHEDLPQTLNFDNPALDSLRKDSQLVAINFENPSFDLVELPTVNSDAEDSPLAGDKVWDLQILDQLSAHSESNHCKGSWLVFNRFEPDNLDKTNEENPITVSPKVRAIAYTPSQVYARTMSSVQRKEQILLELQVMAHDLQNPNWQLIKELTSACIELPLISLDQWKFARYEPDYMLMLAIFGKDLLGKTIYQKAMDELGFHWELVNIHQFTHVWQQYQNYLHDKITQKLDDISLEEQSEILEATLATKRHDLSQNKVFANYFLLIEQDEIQATQKLTNHLINEAFQPVIAQKQTLNEENRQDFWVNPKPLAWLIKNIYQQIDTQHIISFTYQGFMQSVALLPIVLAWLATRQQLSEELLIQKQQLNQQLVALYQVKYFESHWFDNCFDIALQWFYQATKSHT